MEINSDLIKKNDYILSQYGSKCISKRIQRELEGLYKIFNDITVSMDPNGIKIDIKENINNKNYIYGFLITQNYPFTSPKIFFQNKPYIDFLKVNYTKSQFSLIKQVTGKECFCCSSYNCPENWSPAVTVHKIVIEINRMKQLKRNIINKIFADKIKQKYLINDIDLDTFLY
jgi:ubiquitin-protein ligase